MTEAGFLDELGAILDQPGPLARGQRLGAIETFDSLGILNIMALFGQHRLHRTHCKRQADEQHRHQHAPGRIGDANAMFNE